MKLDQFEKNFKAFKKRFSNLRSLDDEYEFFKSNPNGTPDRSYMWVQKPGILANLHLRLPSKNFDGLLLAENPADEAREMLQKVDLSFPQSLAFFGCGLGHLLHSFYKDRPKNNHLLLVFEADIQILFRAFCLYDFVDMIEDNSVHFLIGKTHHEVRPMLASVINRHTTVTRFFKILAQPRALQLDSEFYGQNANQIIQSRDMSVIQAGNSILDCMIGLENILDNGRRACENSGLKNFTNFLGGKGSVLSVASGPSTQKHWDTLKRVQGKIPMIACDSIFQELNRRSIAPDFVTAIERVAIVAGFFKDEPVDPRTSLVGPMVLLDETWRNFQGKHVMYCPSIQNAAALGFDFLGRFTPGSSAGNINVAMAALMGAKNVILVGHDLAFSSDGKFSHSKGSGISSQDKPLTEEELIKKSQGQKTATQDSADQVYTTHLWNIFRFQIENCVSSYPDVNFINTSAKGAKIEGTTLMSLEEALEEYGQEEVDLYESQSDLLPEVSEEESEARRTRLIENIEKMREAIETWSEKGEKLQKKLQQWKEEIEEKESRSKPVSLAYLDDALNETLRVKVSAVNDDRWFYEAAVNIILPAHLAFEREVNQMPGTYKDNYKLKKDFLLRHIDYFNLWSHWLPQFDERYSKALEQLRS